MPELVPLEAGSGALGATPESAEATIIEFYRLLAAGDPDRVVAFVTERFAPGASVSWPDSLPFGGTRTGRERLATFFGRLAGTHPPRGGVDVEVVDVIARPDAAVARLRFVWVGPDGTRAPNGALEWWSFDAQGLVSGIAPYYWDGHAVVVTG